MDFETRVNKAVREFLFMYYNFPHMTTGVVPALFLLERTLRTHLAMNNRVMFLNKDIIMKVQKK